METPRVKKELAWNQVGDEVFILNLEGERWVHQLNVSAAFVFNNLTQSQSVDEIIQQFQQTFEVDAETATNDVTQVLNQLKEKEIINWN